MNMPRFTAEDSLYRTSGHYQTGRQAINLSIQMISVIYPALEVIEVFGCAPGFLSLGEGENMVCIPDPSWSGGGGPGTPEVPLGDGPRGPSGEGPPKRSKGAPPRSTRPRGTFGDGPKRRVLTGFECSGTSIDIETCHSCTDTKKYGRICVCYDCDRGSGECTPGYICTDIYG